MDRRAWLRNAALIAAGTLAADQLELVDRLTHKRRFFAGWSMPTIYADGIHDDADGLQAWFDGNLVKFDGEVWDGSSGNVFVHGRTLITSRTIRGGFPGQTGRGQLTSCYIKWRDHPVDSVFRFPAPNRVRIA